MVKARGRRSRHGSRTSSKEFSPRETQDAYIGVKFRFGTARSLVEDRRPDACGGQTAAAVKSTAALGYENVRVLVATDDASALDTPGSHYPSMPGGRSGGRRGSWHRLFELAHEGPPGRQDQGGDGGRTEVVRREYLWGAAVDMLIDCCFRICGCFSIARALDVYRPPEGHGALRGAPSACLLERRGAI